MAKAQGQSITGSIVAPGVSADYLPIRGCQGFSSRRGTLWITGTFTGSVSLEGSPPDANTFAAVSGQTFTGPVSVGVTCNSNEDLRLNATALSAGTINYNLTFTG